MNIKKVWQKLKKTRNELLENSTELTNHALDF